MSWYRLETGKDRVNTQKFEEMLNDLRKKHILLVSVFSYFCNYLSIQERFQILNYSRKYIYKGFFIFIKVVFFLFSTQLLTD